MAEAWSLISKPKNRQILGWIGGGVAVFASGAWAVVTYVWPAHEDSGIVCAKQGIAAGHDAKGNTITISNAGSGSINAGETTAPCVDKHSK